ncbi:hypothetical protein BRADI_4g33626v3 [Brachypodium distachyon]|uniref:Uncharacterized protein n=1 Tax=Brachypodium distachyon TaxID=15368 RepID=A0A2K2CS15_BRADI|nr:hypothetical protein BRADI_4g33626v3 [Brachypodium distachyon]
MASVERAIAKAAAALLPGLLPTPPTMSTPSPCIVIMPAASNPKFPKPGRADSADRWDACKKSPASSSCGSTSPGRADSCQQRWDINKIKKNPSSMISGKRPPSRASSADRWDAHKKARDDAVSDAESQTRDQAISEDKKKDEATEMEEMASRTHLVFSGPTFVASPEPSTLPMPAFFFARRRAGIGMTPLPALVQASTLVA